MENGKNNNYIPSLDGIRAVSVFIVLISHAGFGHIVPGGFGVTVFFFLSGYLITSLLRNEYFKTGKIHIKHFFLRRFFRLFPPLIISLIVIYLLVYFDLLGGGVSWKGLFAQIFYLANYHLIFVGPGEIADGTGLLWSLAVEEHFYLVFPLLFFTLLKNLNLSRTSIFLIFICVLVLVWRCYLVFFEGASGDRIFYASDTRIDSILLGGILAITYNPLDEKSRDTIRIKEYMFLLIGIVLILSSLLIRHEEFRETLRYTIQGVALMFLFYLSIKYSKNIFFSWLNFRFIRKLGVYSYFIYLIHFVVIRVLQKNLNLDNPYILVLLTSAISIFYAFVLDNYLDKYFRPLRKKIKD